MDYVKNPKAIEDKSMEIIYDYVKGFRFNR